MWLLFKLQKFFDAPDSTTTSPAGMGSELGKEDMIDFMSDDDDPKDVIELEKEKPKKEKDKDKKDSEKGDEIDKDESDKEEEEKEDEVDELEEIERELQGPTEDELELVTPVRRAEILKAYPDLFKKFPYLEKAYYREQQFTEIFPTIVDAKAASQKSQLLDRFEHDLIGNGNTENILRAVHQESPEAFLKLVDNYLPTLAKVDEKAYYHVVGNTVKHTIFAMVQEAKKSNNETLQAAAQILNQFVFGSSDFVPPVNLSKGDNKEDKSKTSELDRRRFEFVKQQLDASVSDLDTRVNNTIKNTIESHIDPNDSMSDYVKRNAVRDALTSLQGLLNQDNRFKTLVDKLWENAANSNFSRDSVDKIKTAYLSKSKTLLGAVIRKARNDALKGAGKRTKNDSDNDNKKGPVAKSSDKPRSTGKITKASEIPRGMSSLDFLNSD